MSNALPATIELCTRIRDGMPCLGRINRSGVPEVVNCTACGKREPGAWYVLIPTSTDGFATMGEAVAALTMRGMIRSKKE